MAVVLSFGVTTVESAIPNNGTYYGCLTKKTGAVKVINYPKVKCATGQKLIKWNAKGPAGPAGPAGAQGPKGDPGPKGDQGPSDWNAIPNIPADLADGQVGWGEVKNKPADFADGKDNEGVTGITLTQVGGTSQPVPGTTGEPTEAGAMVDCPAGSRVTGGGAFTINKYILISLSFPIDADTWQVYVTNTGTDPGSFKPYAVCMSVDPEAALTTAKKGMQPAKVKRALKKRDR